jgi:endoglucanase
MPRFFPLLLSTLLLGIATTHAQTQSAPLLRASGPNIVDAQNRPVLLQGMNLGGWLLQEGYMMKPGYGGTQSSVKKVLYQAGLSDAAVEKFYQQWRDNFITKADIDFIAAQGFNCIRLPLHYDLFLTPAQRAVRNGVIRGTVPYADYVAKLKEWQQKGALFQQPQQLDAIKLIDKTLAWCAANKLYVVLDLHAAPGAQGTDSNIADALQLLERAGVSGYHQRPVGHAS